MKMNKILVLSAITTFMLTNNAFADTAGDTQTVSVTIPSVKLLDVKNASGTSTSANEADALSFTLTAPTIAGENFADVNATGYFDVTSNVASGGATTRNVTVSADTLGEGWKLQLQAGNTTNGTGQTISFTNSDVSSKSLVTGITNEAVKDTSITYTFGPESSGVVPSYTGDGTGGAGQNEDITLTFTLSDDA